MDSSALARKIGMGFAVVVVIFAFKMYNKSSSHDEIKAGLVSGCDEDAACIAAVEENFDRCYEEHYSLGSRRRSGGLDGAEFIKCFNDSATDKGIKLDSYAGSAGE